MLNGIAWHLLLKKTPSLAVFKKSILEFIRPSPNSVFNCHIPIGIKYLTRLRVGLSHLREHKFKHGFQDLLNPMCLCGNDIESTIHFFLHCPSFANERRTLLLTLEQIDKNLTKKDDLSLAETLLFGDKFMNIKVNTQILSATIHYILSTKRFDEALM